MNLVYIKSNRAGQQNCAVSIKSLYTMLTTCFKFPSHFHGIGLRWKELSGFVFAALCIHDHGQWMCNLAKMLPCVPLLMYANYSLFTNEIDSFLI